MAPIYQALQSPNILFLLIKNHTLQVRLQIMWAEICCRYFGLIWTVHSSSFCLISWNFKTISTLSLSRKYFSHYLPWKRFDKPRPIQLTYSVLLMSIWTSSITLSVECINAIACISGSFCSYLGERIYPRARLIHLLWDFLPWEKLIWGTFKQDPVEIRQKRILDMGMLFVIK